MTSGAAGWAGGRERLRLTERFRRREAQIGHDEVTVTDPAIVSRPWTAALHLRNDPRITDVFDYACHERNCAMCNILSGARAAEGAATGKGSPCADRDSGPARAGTRAPALTERRSRA